MNFKNQFNIGQDKGRLKRSLSRKKMPSEKIKEEKTSPQQDKHILTDFEVPIVNMVTEAFEKQILKPINFHEDVFNSQNPPKCIVHNNIQTLYCLNDKRPLCAGCLYSNQLHKTHKVVPLTKALTSIKQDYEENLMASKKGLIFMEDLVKKNEQNLIRIEKEYPQLVQKVHDFYLQLHEKLVEKKNQQLEAISENWARLRFTYNLKRYQLEKMITFLKVRLESASHSSKEHQLHYRNVTLQLSKIKNIFVENYGVEEENRFEKDIKEFSQVKTFIQNNLIFTNLYNLEKEKKALQNSQRMSFGLKSKRKKSLKKLPLDTSIKSPTELSPLSSARDQTPPPRHHQRSLSRNRHSKTDLHKKWTLYQERIEREKHKTRQKNNEFHSMIIEKSQKSLLKKQMSKIKTQSKSKSKSKK